MMSLGTTALGSEREREVREGLGPTPNTAWAVRIHSREAGWGFSGWKITKRNIKGKGGRLAKSTYTNRILDKDRPGDQTSGILSKTRLYKEVHRWA